MSHFRDRHDDAADVIDMIYEKLEGAEELANYHQRHGTPSLIILTMYHPETAAHAAELMAQDIDGKHVIEIGAGVGHLAVAMAKRAKSVIAIEVDPGWSWHFTRFLYREKPANLTWIFGRAEDVATWIRPAEVAVVCSRSGLKEMGDIAARLAPKVIFPLQEFDVLTRERWDNDLSEEWGR